MKFNNWEQTFNKVVEEASHWVSEGKELEIVHCDQEDMVSGWYAYEYDGNQAVPIYKNGYDKKALISDDTVSVNGVNVKKILDQLNVYYSEC